MDDARSSPSTFPVGRSAALLALATGLGGTLGAVLLSLRGVEPVATWLYSFAWYPLLLAFEGGIALRHGRFLLLGRPRRLLAVLAWSVPVWMLWELLNFRLENWHYVFVPDRRPALWTGVIVSFATVLPACFLPSALLRSPDADASSRTQDPPRPSRALLAVVRLAGLVMLLLPLVRPRYFFPLVWGGFVLLAEPDVVRGAPDRSLLVDALDRRWGRIGALLGGGALAGLAWESLNAAARAGWIYTVPGMEAIKLFEMPPLGFLGFPPLALSCFSIYQWLALRGWAPPFDLDPSRADRRSAPRGAVSARGRGAGWRWAARTLGVVVVVVTLLGMEAWTISSRTPRMRDLPGLMPSDVETLRAWGVGSPFDLADADPARLADRVPEADPDEAERWVGAARLATLRGTGTRNARLLSSWGVRSPADLARADPEEVARCFRRIGETRVRPARVRVWWRAARERTGVEGAPEPGVEDLLEPDCPSG